MGNSWRWRRPVLDRAGQQAFWDRQSATYDEADMTTDNEGELAHVRSFCRGFVERGYTAEDVVTLGGASGCRDPLVVLDALKPHQHPRGLVFNDLSERMVQRAFKRFRDTGIAQAYDVQGIHGPIHEIADRIPSLPRRVIIGVYRSRAFLEANGNEGQPHSGLEGYLRNGVALGDHFFIEAVGFNGGRYDERGPRMEVAVDDTARLPAMIKEIGSWETDDQFTATRVVGCHARKPGFFISHWYSEKGIRNLINKCFPRSRCANTSFAECAKGYVLCIDPVGPPQGILTLLNNVLGNVLPQEQADTLRAIERISS